LEHTTLDCGTDRNYFVRVNALVPLFAEQLFYQLLDARHARLTTNQHDLFDVARVDAGIFHALLRRRNRALNQILNHRFQFCPG
jgi:hypothetical protein